MRRTRRIIAAMMAAACLATAAPPPVHAAGIQDQMDSLFGSMSNTTAPGVWNTQRRGVFAGGQYTAKNRIMNENIISFVPPSFEAGCGGIDLFGGSFSFINAEQFVQLMRGVAANAAGYAFQLALGSMCQDCAAIIENLQKKIQQLNQFFGNSCQLAQGIVNDTLGAALKKQDTEASKISFTKGIGDIFESWTQTTGESPVTKAATNAPDAFKKRVQGNLVWRALKSKSVSSWFSGGDEAMLEAMMNVTGTVIVGEMKDAGDGKKQPEYTRLAGNKIRLKDLIDGTQGASVTMYRCDTKDEDGCLKPTTQSVPLKGFRKMLHEKLLDGSGGTLGLVYRIASNNGSLSAADRDFLAPRGYGLASLIFQQAKHGAAGAVALTEQAIPHLAFDMAVLMVEDMMKAVDAAVAVSDDPSTKELFNLLQQSKIDLRAEQQTMRGQIGDPTSIYQTHINILELTQKMRYSATGHSIRD